MQHLFLRLLYFTNPAYVAGASALAIFVCWYDILLIVFNFNKYCSGNWKPRIPMYILIFGSILTAILNWVMVPTLGIAGGAAATSIACFAMMVPILFIWYLN